MKSDSVINFLQYILGMFFNLAIMAIVGYAVFALTIAGFNWGTNFAYEMVAVGPNQEFIFVLDEDTPASEVSRQLEYKGIINSSRLFNLELFLMGRIRTYRAGTYTLNSNMTNTEVHRTFLRTGSGQAPHETITIPEGWTIDDMAAYFEYRGFFTADEFIYTAHYMYFGFSFCWISPPIAPTGWKATSSRTHTRYPLIPGREILLCVCYDDLTKFLMTICESRPTTWALPWTMS